MDSKNINRIWMIKKLKFFRFCFHLSIFAALICFLLFGVLASFICVAAAALLAALADMVRIDLDYPSVP